jgi:hypothetical protein
MNDYQLGLARDCECLFYPWTVAQITPPAANRLTARVPPNLNLKKILATIATEHWNCAKVNGTHSSSISGFEDRYTGTALIGVLKANFEHVFSLAVDNASHLRLLVTCPPCSI